MPERATRCCSAPATRRPGSARRASWRRSSTGRIRAVRLDVTDAGRAAALAAGIKAARGARGRPGDNAAGHYDTWQTAADADLGVVREAIETNVLGAWQTTLALLPLLRRSAHPRVVMVSSEGGSLASMGGGASGLPRQQGGAERADQDARRRPPPRPHPRQRRVPGWVATDMGGPGGRPVAAGAASIMYAVDLPDDGPTSTFTRDGRQVPW